ncbi:MAG: DUF222 domain-containing protein [Microbacteriaceae bacterium]|nr:DUF222 domain-containing protein [Microbacteriaceae bacterium]
MLVPSASEPGEVVMSAELLEPVAALASMLDGRSAESLGDAELVRALDLMGEARHRWEGLTAGVANEAARRDIALREGYRGDADLVADRCGVDVDEARTLCRVGAAVAPRVAMSGEVLDPLHPPIAEGLASGTLTIGQAGIILGAIERIEPFVDVERRMEFERVLVDQAPDLSRRQLVRVARRLLDHVDPDGAEPREDLLRARSGIRIVHTADGLVRWIVTMHPEAAGILTAAVDARTAPRRQPRFSEESEVDVDLAVEADPRTLGQRKLDALVDVVRLGLAHDEGTVAGAPVTMLVTVGLDELRSGLGTAQIAGVDEPISAATARRLACDARILPAVMGSSPEPLDLGREERLFSRAQRRALALRDGGCVWPGCDAPPGWCEVAHLLAWYLGGATDLRNGVLMCPFHHRRHDQDGWQLEWRGDDLVLIPPAHLDRERRPRRAGRARAGRPREAVML